MTEENQSNSTESLKEYIESIGGTVATIDTVRSDEGEVSDILVCFHGDHRYALVEAPNHPYYEIRYEFSLTEHIATALSQDAISERTGLDPEEIDEIRKVDRNLLDSDEGEIVIAQNGEDLPPSFLVAQDIIESLDEDVLERFGLNLFQELSQPEVAASLTRTDNGYFDGFRIKRKIFPDDSGFSLTELNNSIQSVITVGTFGNNWIAQLIGSELEEEFEQFDMG
ncbi:hypothetical protein [Haloferax volcanii]|uniref:hypothetical protein n=1 Tax=Haloferax volcanii TaxID=2246 RepID=UPI003D303A07